ncbi:MAG: phosphoglycerate dehydrogenase [Bdellovibrionota bacterium]
MNVLLLENIHPLAKEIFEMEGFNVELLSESLSQDKLIEKLRGVQILGIRSKTQIDESIFKKSESLLALGCFCIGTNQVNLEAAKQRGVAVFNAPFGNTRSVAEMIIAEIISLSRKLGQRNMEMHTKTWKKTAESCYEIRGKTIGIIGYGNIGTQVGTMAESLGMHVLFYDIVPKLPRGNARNCNTINEVLKNSDFVTLHVPATPQTRLMMSEPQLLSMKAGSYLLNASRGNVVDVAALAKAIKSKHLAGAAVDVFPNEPEQNTNSFSSDLQGLPNVILTPHIGGGTEEAQSNIGQEVPVTLIRYIKNGSTNHSVNFPEVDLPKAANRHRILNIHKNVPGVLSEINRIISELGANIEAEALATDNEIGYLLLDTDKAISQEVKTAIESLKTSIKTRILG